MLLPCERSPSGYRLYSEAQAKLLRFVLQAKKVGFRLEEIQNIVHLGRTGPVCGYVRETVAGHIKAIDIQIEELQELRDQLAQAEMAWQKTNASLDGEICGLIEGWFDSPKQEDGY